MLDGAVNRIACMHIAASNNINSECGLSGDNLFAKSPPNQTEEDFKRAVSLFTLKI